MNWKKSLEAELEGFTAYSEYESIRSAIEHLVGRPDMDGDDARTGYWSKSLDGTITVLCGWGGQPVFEFDPADRDAVLKFIDEWEDEQGDEWDDPDDMDKAYRRAVEAD